MVISLLEKYSVGLYIRLSREDDDKVYESESITNQKSLLLQYVDENNLNVYDIYIDDGYSGTNFDRPAFNRLLGDIELGRVNMVITKDMSRLGRDYIGTGSLIEKYFPKHNVRYIAVTDNIDTFLDNSNNDIAPFKAIMNDMYAKDISKKIRASLKAKQKEGKWVGGRTPFGYDQDPNDKNHLVINEEQAIIVRTIYDMCLDGLSFFKIAKKLTDEKIKTPAGYYDFKWKRGYNLKLGEWNSKTVRDILTNQMYIGDMVQNRRSKINYKVKKVVRNNPKDYIIVEDTHEAIIDKETFYEVQKRIPKNVGRSEKKENHLLDGLLYCGDCGHRISITSRRKKDNRCYTICNYYRTYMKQKLCTTHSNNYDEMEKVIISSLVDRFIKYIDRDKIRSTVLNNLNKSNQNNGKRELELINTRIEQINDNLDTVYLDKLNKKITLEQYERIKIRLEGELDTIKRKYNELNNIIYNDKFRDKIMIKYVNDFLFMRDFSRELIVCLIDRIEIFDDKSINVIVNFDIVN